MIKIIDYGIGNIQAIINVYKRLHIPVSIAKTVADLASADKLILPGVGSFDQAMQEFTKSGLREKVTELVLQKKTPVLGICVGMQMLAERSDEGAEIGLGWIPGRVRSFSSLPAIENLALPHMGWNDVRPAKGNALFKGIESDACFYFLHSYFFECQSCESEAAQSDYGVDFSCAVVKDNIYGVQFHPEKSHSFGETLLKNFAEL